MSRKLLIFCAVVVLVVFLRGGIYFLVSSIHRLLFDRKWKNVVLPKRNIDQQAEVMAGFKWRRDGPRELFDAVCSPQKVHAEGFDDLSSHSNDCDEEAIYNVNVIEDDRVLEQYFFTVTWFEPELKRFSGHNVCLLRYDTGWCYMDYGKPRAICETPRQVADMVIRNYTGHSSRRGLFVLGCAAGKNLLPKFLVK